MHDSNSGHRPHKLRYTSAINQKTQKKNNDDVIYSLTKKIDIRVITKYLANYLGYLVYIARFLQVEYPLNTLL